MLNINDEPSILKQSTTESENLGRLSWKSSNECFKVKLSGQSEYVKAEFDKSEIALDLMNMDCGYIKWIVGQNEPVKVIAPITQPQPPHPNKMDKDWKQLRSMKALIPSTGTKLFFDADTTGGIMGVDDALKLMLDYCRNNNVTLETAKQSYAVFLYTGATNVAFKTGYSTKKPTFKMHKLIPIEGSSSASIEVNSIDEIRSKVEEQNNITKFKNEVQL